ncbi:MAG: CoA transferase [Chloroflexi bacterium]|nr:CoA transferase [Chloroflexota bacterium]
MNQDDGSVGALSHVRVLDLSDEKGVYAAKLLADLGADTIKVEPPGGDLTRQFGPFVDDVPDPARSLFFFHYNTNKRGITLDVERAEGRRLLLELVRRADILIESFPPGFLAGLDLAYADLARINPGLVMASITPFGQHGPHAHYKGSDLVAWAMSGYMAIMGYEDLSLPPLTVPFLQCCHTAGYYAATTALAAVLYRATTGRGQHIDVSMQEAMATMSETPNVFYSMDEVVLTRQWGYNGDPSGLRVFRSKDGYVDMGLGPFRRDIWPRWMTWMDADGQLGDLGDERWLDREWGMAHCDQMYGQVEAWTTTRTGYDLFNEAQTRRLEVAPVNDIPAVLADPQLNARGYFVQVPHPELDRTVTYAGAPYDLHGTPWSIRRRAPLLGEHNREIYLGELGLTEQALQEHREHGVI